jgi:ATP-dependent RNA/DNA helicase IGHMBP2
MGMKVLACAGSNIAVDNMVERIAKTDLKVMRVGHPARMLPSIYEQCLDHKLRRTTCYKELKTLKQNINR